MGQITTNLKQYREAQGMTQKELAERVGVRRETIVHLENDKYNPSLELAMSLAQIFEVPVEQLFHLQPK